MDGARATHAQATAQAAQKDAPRPAPLRAPSQPLRGPHMPAVRPPVRLNPQAVSTDASTNASNALPPHVARLASSSSSGEALPSSVQVALEGSLGVPLRGVRVHTDSGSAAAAAGMGARAFTYGTHVFLGPRERPTDLRLMAHEVTHVVQQQGRPVVQMCCAGCCGTTPSGNSFEREASSAAAAVTSGVPFTVQGRTGGAQVQREDGGQEDEGLLTRMLWGLLEEISPEFTQMLREIVRHGVIEWLKGKISAAVESIFNTLAAPVREVTGVVASLSLHFNNLIAWVRDAAARIARGDCSAVTEAAQKIQEVFEGLAAPVIDRIKHLADRVKGFFSGLWERFGAPAWEFLRRVGGQAWEKIQQFGRWIWEKTARVRSTLARAWRWIKNKLGIGEGEEGQNGLLQWVQRKASAAWDWLKERLEPIKRPLMIVGGILVMLSPAGPIIAIGAAVGGLLVGIRWIRQHMSRPGGVVEQRNAFERTIIPAIMGAVNGVTSGLQRAAAFITDKLNGVMAGLGNAVGAVAGSIFRFAVSIIQWIADQFRALVNWATEKLMGLVDWVRGALERLRVFLQPVLNFLGRVGRAVANIMRLPFELAGSVWNMIPACIRDPFVNFFIPLILGRIPLFRELVGTPEAWARTRAEVMTIVRQIFRDFDLIGAMKGVFRLIIRALGIPVDLVQRILAKAATAWDAVLDHPIQFLKNILRAMGLGFSRFFGNILSHLLYGVSGWIFGELREVGVTPPSSWTDLRAVFGFVLSVLGITIDHIFELLGRRLSPERVQQLRRAYNFLSGAWEWVKVAIAEGPAGIWRMMVQRLRDLGETVLRAAVDWIIDTIVTRVTARLLSMLDPTGIMAVVNALVSLYQAIQTVVRYARQILEIVNRVLDTIVNIARGVLDPAAEMMENAMRSAMPVIIAFLANQAGLSGLGARMREIIASIRERVDAALLWLIDLALRALQALMSMLGLGGQRPGTQPPGRPAGAIGKVVNFTAAGETHQIFIVKQGTNAVLMMASERKPLSEHEAQLKQVAERGMDDSDSAQVKAKVDAGAAEEVKVDRKADQVAAGTATANPQADEREIEQGQDKIAEQMRLALEKFRTTASGKRFERFRDHSDYKPADVSPPKFAPAADASSGYAKSSFGSFMLAAYSGYVEENIIKPKQLTREAYRLDMVAAIRASRLSKVSEMKYVIIEPVAGGPAYSTDVIDKAENVADATLKRVVRGIGGILRFMEHMARGRVTVGSDTIDTVAFARFWAVPENKTWLKNELRGEVSGRHHEWIPVSMIQEVINRASLETDINAAAKWIALHNELRTSTRWIVFKPSIGGSTVTIEPRTYQILNGHSGNLKRMENGVLKDATVNQKEFHDACRDAFRNNNSTPVAAITALEGVFQTWIWDGSPLTYPVHPDMHDSYAQPIADRVSLFSARQAIYYSEIIEYFREMKRKYS